MQKVDLLQIDLYKLDPSLHSKVITNLMLFHLVKSPEHKHRIICCSLDKSES